MSFERFLHRLQETALFVVVAVPAAIVLLLSLLVAPSEYRIEPIIGIVLGSAFVLIGLRKLRQPLCLLPFFICAAVFWAMVALDQIRLTEFGPVAYVFVPTCGALIAGHEVGEHVKSCQQVT